ncbi:MAG: ABC transporter permease [Pyrinomonadaceae bacterium]
MAIIVIGIVIFGDAVAPYGYEKQVRNEPNAPASTIRFRDGEGDFHLRPFVYQRRIVDRLGYGYEEATDQIVAISLFASGDDYSIFGVFNSDFHLFGTRDPAVRLTLLGTDSLGRDRFSRLVNAVRFSLVVCLIGTVFASLIGVILGMIGGYSNRFADTVLMGITDSVLALPTLILILAARAAFPLELPPFRAATLLIAIFALAGWAEMARLARGLVKATREKEFITAAKSSGGSEIAILFRHILPNIAPALVAQATIMLPYFLLSEVALSFLGVGLQEPVPSLGNMLASASDLGQLQQHPVLLLSPAIVIFIFVLLVRLMTIPFKDSDRRLQVG